MKPETKDKLKSVIPSMCLIILLIAMAFILPFKIYIYIPVFVCGVGIGMGICTWNSKRLVDHFFKKETEKAKAELNGLVVNEKNIKEILNPFIKYSEN